MAAKGTRPEEILMVAACGRGTGEEREWAVMTHKYRGSQQSLREVLPKFIDSTQGEPKNICKP
jgi:hypothetical protein